MPLADEESVAVRRNERPREEWEAGSLRAEVCIGRYWPCPAVAYCAVDLAVKVAKRRERPMEIDQERLCCGCMTISQNVNPSR